MPKTSFTQPITRGPRSMPVMTTGRPTPPVSRPLPQPYVTRLSGRTGPGIRATSTRAAHPAARGDPPCGSIQGGPRNSTVEDPRSARERGSASILAVAIGLTVLLLAIAIAAIAAAMVARHQAQAAADFAALAAAPHALAGQEFACALALHIAEANGGRLVKCAVDGLDAVTTVAVSIDLPVPGLGARTAEATSRAGPADLSQPPDPNQPDEPNQLGATTVPADTEGAL